MHYPWWHVPQLTAPMLIAVVATIHVLVAHYAVGGGLFLAVETAHAYRTKDPQYLEYLHGHTRWFVLLTVAFGAITGVGIWWTIGLASPLATEVLIRTFVFGWATEYVFFVLEIVSAFAFYYYWGRLPEKTHLAIGRIYAFAAWMSLVLITGITAFMLWPGEAWLSDRDSFWKGFFNPQFVPQTIARTGGALLLTSLYVYFHASLAIRDRRLQELIAGRSARPALAGAILVTVGGLGWYAFLPESARAALDSAAALAVLTVLIFALTIIVFVLLYLGPYRNPGWLSPGFAGALMLFGVAAFTTGEFIREAVRKPYVIYNVVLGNQVRPEEVPTLRREGYLQGGLWTRAFVRDYADKHQLDLVRDGRIELGGLVARSDPESIVHRRVLGGVLYQYHCDDCHAVQRGYSAVAPLIRGRSREAILWTIRHLDEGHFFMPPWSGTDDEAEVLADYLQGIAPPRPAGMFPETRP